MRYITLSIEQPDARELRRYQTAVAKYEERMEPYGDLSLLSADTQASLRSQRPRLPEPFSYQDQIVTFLLSDLGKEGLTDKERRYRRKLAEKVEDAEPSAVFGFEDAEYELVNKLVSEARWLQVRACFDNFVSAVNDATEKPGLPQLNGHDAEAYIPELVDVAVG